MKKVLTRYRLFIVLRIWDLIPTRSTQEEELCELSICHSMLSSDMLIYIVLSATPLAQRELARS